MIFDIRLKTGFYETKPYCLSIGRGVLELLPEEFGEKIRIFMEKEILSVTLMGKGSAEVEIQTADRLYHMVLCDPLHSGELYQSVKENLRVRIDFEYAYEGGL